MPGNDSDVKKYLATCWQNLKEDHNKLTRLYDDTKATLSQKLENAQQVCLHFFLKIIFSYLK
jgi:hypothetical protein